MPPCRFHLTEATDSLARLQSIPRGATLTGPRCKYARTLPATFSLRDGSTGPEILVTEPCYWTADLPFLYDLRMEDGSQQSIGLRGLSVRGQHVHVEGKRFVFRAARHFRDDPVNWTSWRDARLAMYVVDPSEELCQAASEMGVWIIAESSGAAEANEVADFPAVGVIVVSQAELTGIERFPGGPLVGVHIVNDESIAQAKADVVVYEANNSATTKRDLTGCRQPAIAVRLKDEFHTLAEARTACEHLQRDLAPELNLAGYVV